MTTKRVFILLLLALFLMAGVFVVCQLDDSYGARSLNLATPLVTALNPVGSSLLNQGPTSWYGLLAAIGVIGVLVGVISRDRVRRNFFCGTLIALITQFFLINQQWQLALATVTKMTTNGKLPAEVLLATGIAGYFIAALFVRAAVRKDSDLRLAFSSSRSDDPLSWFDCSVLLGIFVLGLFFRTYALNQISNGFEGELACYMSGATSLKGMLIANEGVHGPWAPLGILYYLPIYLTTKLFGTTILAVRLSSVLVGVFTIFPLFFFVRMVAGTRAGLFAAFLFALDCLHVGWSRTDIHPHGVTTWPTLLLCISLLKLVRTGHLIWAFAVAALMGLSWHQYPSGQTAVVIPLIAAVLYAISNRGALPFSRGKMLIVAFGVVLWVLGLPLSRYLGKGHFSFINPFTLTGPRAIWGTGDASAELLDKVVYVLLSTLRHCLEFGQGLFYQAAYMFHQEWAPQTEALTVRTVDWSVIALAMIGVFVVMAQRKRFESAVFVAWIIAAILPGILSSHAYAKRLSTIFPAIDCLAGIVLSLCFTLVPPGWLHWRKWLLRGAATVSMSCYVAYSSYIWFSGRFWRYAEPPEVKMTKEIQETIPPSTIVIADLGQSYESSKVTFLLLDFLSSPQNRPNLLSFYRTEHYPVMIQDPFKAQNQLSTNLIYLWTKLRDQAAETGEYKEWKYVNFLIVDTFHNQSQNVDLIQSATARCNHPTVRRIHSSANSEQWKMISITSVLCEVSDFAS
jgi:hypothetical protein